jgi:flavin-dependent dehydrogenase
VTYDVVIAGGGPGGSVTALRLAQKGRKVLVLEKGKHPRFHLGESLLPQSLPVFEAIGALEDIRARFIQKNGANFHESGTGKTNRYPFREAFNAKVADHAFQVPRDEFDELLFRLASRSGADAREGWTVRRFDPRERAVFAADPSGKGHVFETRFFVDASGRDALTAHDSRSVKRIADLDKTALFSHWRKVWRDEGEAEGDIQIVCFAAGWFWFIPFKDGRTSVGAVVSSQWIRESKGSPQEMFLRAVAQSDAAQRLLGGAEQVFDAGATADFSFRVRDLVGERMICVGDAGGFIDPLFSTGAHLAMYGALHGADEIDRALAADDFTRERFAAWERLVRSGTDLFVGAVQAFYQGILQPYLFAEKQHPFMRKAITSMLSGDVFDENARWAKEMRSRFPARP